LRQRTLRGRDLKGVAAEYSIARSAAHGSPISVAAEAVGATINAIAAAVPATYG
jgi:hypothetical protein